MKSGIDLEGVYRKSEEVVSREIKGELIIVPVAHGIGDMEDELYTLNETGRKIWDRLDGKRSVREIASLLEAEYDAKPETIRKEVTALIDEFMKRKMLVSVGGQPG